MNKILTIHESDIVGGVEKDSHIVYKERLAARAVLMDENGRIALMHAGRLDYYKLPGGGVEDGEDIKTALARELLEEVGAEAGIISEIGWVEEYRDYKQMRGVSYAWSAKARGVIGQPSLTEHEISEGFEVVWVDTIDEAIEKVSSASTYDDLGVKFMTTRDSAILKEFRSQ